MSFFADIGTALAVDGVGRGFARARRAAQLWVRHVRWGRTLRETETQVRHLHESLLNALASLERVGDHLLQLDQAGVPFDPHKVLIEAHTKGLFKLPQPVITASRQDTNTLNINCGRRHGVIAGVCLSIVSKDGQCHKRYTLREADIRDDHLCIRPPEVDLSVVNAKDLIVSFIQCADLSASERALSLLLDETLAAATQIKAVLPAPAHPTRSGD